MKICANSKIEYFEKVIGISEKIVMEINDMDRLFSPYSLHPLVTQIIGLDTPLMGSGDSPYSIISVASKIRQKAIFQKAFNLPLYEKRLIIDEFYDMLAPLLLDDEDNYVELMLKTRYKVSPEGESKNRLNIYEKTLKEKLLILKSFIKRFKYKKGCFAQIAHYGDIKDTYREFSFLQSLSKNSSLQWFNNSYPVVNELLIKNFPDVKTGKTKSITGWVIFITNSTSQLLEDGKLRKKKILQSAHLAEKLGAKIIGMAGLIASFAQGGHELSKKIPTVGFTTGHAFTVGNIMAIIDKCARKVNLDIKKSIIAIVGAGGSIGSGCAELMLQKNPKKLILVDVSSFIGQEKLKEVAAKINRFDYAKNKIRLSVKLKDIKEADLIICATSSMHSIIKPEFLKTGAIVIDDSFPKNISKDILKKRNDVVFLEGGITQLPRSIDIYAARNMPDLLDVPITRAFSCKETYACLTELLVLSLMSHKGNYGLGLTDIRLSKKIMKRSREFGISTAPMQCFDQAVEGARFERVRHIIANKRIDYV